MVNQLLKHTFKIQWLTTSDRKNFIAFVVQCKKVYLEL